MGHDPGHHEHRQYLVAQHQPETGAAPGLGRRRSAQRGFRYGRAGGHASIRRWLAEQPGQQRQRQAQFEHAVDQESAAPAPRFEALVADQQAQRPAHPEAQA